MLSNLFNWFPVTKGLHQLAPQDVYEEAEQYAKVRVRERERRMEINMSSFKDAVKDSDSEEEDL